MVDAVFRVEFFNTTSYQDNSSTVKHNIELQLHSNSLCNDENDGIIHSVSDPYSFFTDPDPVDPDGGQYGSGYGSGSNPDPGL